MLYTVPGVPRFGTRKTGEPPGSSPGKILANQIRTLVPPVSQVALPRERIPSLSVIFRPVLRSDILRGNNPSQLSPDDNLPHLRISPACTTCIAQAFCSREIFYHIFVHLASVFSRFFRKNPIFLFYFLLLASRLKFCAERTISRAPFRWKTGATLSGCPKKAPVIQKPSPSSLHDAASPEGRGSGTKPLSLLRRQLP